jgi:hypothetical protein
MHKGIWLLAQEEAQTLKAKYQILYQNRLAYEKQEKKM